MATAICLSHLCLLPTPCTAMRRTRHMGSMSPPGRCRSTSSCSPSWLSGGRRRVRQTARPCDPASTASFGEPSRQSCQLRVRTPSLVPASPTRGPNSPPDRLPPPDGRPRCEQSRRHQLLAVDRSLGAAFVNGRSFIGGEARCLVVSSTALNASTFWRWQKRGAMTTLCQCAVCVLTTASWIVRRASVAHGRPCRRQP
jgi:hypothetical protein